ncbi:MAG TPA: MFS transporter, partial [Hyphomicrobiaceae bacterium]
MTWAASSARPSPTAPSPAAPTAGSPPPSPTPPARPPPPPRTARARWSSYYLSYLFRSINALIAGDLTTELGLSAADLGLLTSVYFLVFAAVVLPCGVLLDRYGPRLIDSALLLLAAAGSLLFAVADGVATLLV